MGRASVKENKSVYQTVREELGLSREKAAERLDGVPAEKIEKIENGKAAAHPDEILSMAEGYGAPQLCNFYCANECPIGRRYVPEVSLQDLSRIVLEMLSSLNGISRQRERLIDISADGVITGDEIADFVKIQNTLESLSVNVEALQLWTEQMLARGSIDREAYEHFRASQP